MAWPGLRVIGRQRRAGSHALLLHLLAEAELRLDEVGFLPDPAMVEDAVAAAVAEDWAAAGFRIHVAAAARGLGFVPLLQERFDRVIDRKAYFKASVQALLCFTRSLAFAARAGRMGGYDTTGTGSIAFNL